MMLLSSKRLEGKPIDGQDQLWHLFKEEFASPQSELDLLTCRENGERLVNSYIARSILRQPSSQQQPLKKQYLRGFEPLKPKTRKAKDLEKIAAKKSLWIMKRLLEAERKGRPFDTDLTVTNPISLALFDSAGDMRKGAKSDFNRYLVEKEFPETLSNQYPATKAWIVEGMFMINSIPLANCKNVGDYASQLVIQWLKWRLNGESTASQMLEQHAEAK
jgi:hypothetical protein